MNTYEEGQLQVLKNAMIKCLSVKYGVLKEEAEEFIKEELEIIDVDDASTLINIILKTESVEESKEAIKLIPVFRNLITR